MSKEIGLRIRELRQSYNMTLDELAELLGITPGFLGMNERGFRGVNLSRYIKLSEIFNVSLDYLLAGRGEPPKKIGDNNAAFIESVLNEHELQMIAEFVKRLSMYNYTEEEINLISEAINFQLSFINSIKALNAPHDD